MNHIEAMKRALEALETYHGYMEPLTTVFGGPRVPAEQSTTGKVEKAITSLRQAIAEAEKQEPVAWHEPGAYGNVTTHKDWALANGWQPLHTHPQPKREWVGLTDEERSACRYWACEDFATFGRAIEAKLKEKNT